MMLESTRGQKFCEKETIQTLATLFDSWPGMDNDISSCNMVSKVFCLLLSWFIVVSNSSTCRFIFLMHPSADTSCTSSTKRHIVCTLWTLFIHHNRQRIKIEACSEVKRFCEGIQRSTRNKAAWLKFRYI